MPLIVRGRVWKFDDNISTDLMMPGFARTQGMSERELARYCMYSNRPGWSDQVKEGDIIVAGRNWGCGSSRPAPRMFKVLAVGGVIADSISRLFFRNAVNIGFPVLICPGVSASVEEGEEVEVNFETGEVRNLIRGTVLQGEAIPADSPPYQILKAGGLEPLLRQTVARMNGSEAEKR